jgi:arylsulfatase A-like enzyme/Flp pilus assembly protein TadD
VEQLAMRYRRRVKLWILVVLLLAAAAVAVSRLMVEVRPSIRNVVLISIDTCRADHLNCYGFARRTTPNIDAITQQAVLFENAYTPIPLTLPSHSSMLTGTYPPYHKVHDNLSCRLDESNLTLSEILRERGYTTGAVISSSIISSQFGIGQGFETFDERFVEKVGLHNDVERRGGEASRVACSFLEQHKDKSFFLFLHYYDPHTDYAPPEPFATKYADDLYSGEIAYTDSCIGQVIEKLKGLGLYDSTLLIIVGDHGESLGEHGETEHGYYIYQSTMRVPFIIRPPGFRGAKRVKDVVSLVDITPTILGYLDIAIPVHVQGLDLSGYSGSRSHSNTDRQVYLESMMATMYGCNPLLGLAGQQYKYIRTTNSELYNLPNDPAEKNNLIVEQAKRARLMQGQLEELVGKLSAGRQVGSEMTLDDETRRRLESLGYVGTGGVSETLEFDAGKADPKDYIEYFERSQKVRYLKFDEKFAEARSVCEDMLRQWPELPNTYFMLTEVAFAEGNMADVIKYGSEFLSARAGDVSSQDSDGDSRSTIPIAMAHRFVAQAAYELGRYDLAVQHLTEALRLKSDWPEVYDELGAAYYKQEKLEQAMQNWKEALRYRPDWPEAHNHLALAFYKQGNIDEAIKHWREALRLKPDWAEVRDNLDKLERRRMGEQAIARYVEMLQNDPNDASTRDRLAAELYQQSKIEQAIEQWKEVITLRPEWAEAQNSLATAYYRQRGIVEAIKHWTEAVRLKPDWAEAMNNLAWVLAAANDESLRNTDEAVRLAERACELTKYESAGMLDTLAVAYAAAGRFTDAIGTAEKAVELALETKQNELVEQIRNRLKLYKMDKAYRD